MLFEKPKLNRPISLDFIGCMLLVVIVTAYFTYGVCVIYGVIGSFDNSHKITFLDLVNGFAQIATALAFILALIQYRKNIIQQRQLNIATEAKSQLDKMIDVISKIKTGKETCLNNLNKSITLLSNLATNFEALFKAMEEDIQRAIVRMQWQDMYFNYLRHALCELDLAAILQKEPSIAKENLEAALAEARAASEKDNVIAVFKNYVFTKELISHEKIAPFFSMKEKIDSLDMFTSYYLNDHNLNDLLYGLLSRIDIRVCAPLLAVAEPKEWALKKLK
jgi:hypothetical protein